MPHVCASTRNTLFATLATAALCLNGSALAAAGPLNRLPQDPAQPCGGSALSPGSAAASVTAFIPVAGDPAAYQKCGPAGTPLGIKHCPKGSAFDAATSYCTTQEGTEATLNVEAVWKGVGGDGQPCSSVCQPKPIDVKLAYSSGSVGMASVTVSDPAVPGRAWGGSDDMLLGDNQTHSVVIAANSLNPESGDWSPKAGDAVLVQAYLTSGKSNADGDPVIALAKVTQTVEATTRPSAQ